MFTVGPLGFGQDRVALCSFTSSALRPTEHTAHVPDSGWLHSTAAAVLGDHSMALVFKALEFPLYLGCTFTNRLSPGTLTLPHGAKRQLLATISSILGLLLQLRLHLYQWPSIASNSAKPPLLIVTPSCLQSQWGIPKHS